MSKTGKVIALGSTSNETLVPITDAQFVQYPNSKLTTQVKNIRGILEDADCVNVKDTLDVLTNMATDGTMPNIVTFATKAALDADEETRNNGTIAYVTETDEYFMLSEGTNIAKKEWSRLTNNVYYFGSFVDGLRSGQMTYEQWVKLNEIKNEYPIISYDRCIVIIQIVDEGYRASQEITDPISGKDDNTVGGKKGDNIDPSVIDNSKTNKVHIRWYSLNDKTIWDIYNEAVPNKWFEDDFAPSGTDTENDDYITVHFKSVINVDSENFSDYTSRIRQDISNLQNDKANKAMIVNFTRDRQTGEFSADKSFSTIYTAFNDGTNIIGQWQSRTYTTFNVNDASIQFYTLSAEEGIMSGLEIFSDEHIDHYVRDTIDAVDYTHLMYSADIDNLYIGKPDTPVEGEYMPYTSFTSRNQQWNKDRYAGVYAVLDEETQTVIDHLLLSKTDTPPEGSVMVYFKPSDFTDKSLALDTVHTVAMSYQTPDETMPYEQTMTIREWDALAANPNSAFIQWKYSDLLEYGLTNYEESHTNAIIFFDKNGRLIEDSIIDTSRFAGGINNVEVVGDKLAVTYNLGDGTTKTVEIPLGDLFDQDDYYTTTQVDGKIAAMSHYDATWLIANDGSAEEYTYEYTVSHTRYNDLVTAINAKKLIFAKTSNKEVYFNVFTDNNDYILMQFIQNNRRMNYHVYHTNNDGVHTVQKRRADFAYNDNVYSKQDVYTKSETDDKFVGSLVVRLASNTSILNGVTFQEVYDALIAGKHVVYVQDNEATYTVETFDSTAIQLKAYTINRPERTMIINNIVHNSSDKLQYYYTFVPLRNYYNQHTQALEGARQIGYRSDNNTNITDVTNVSAALGKVDALINTISTDLDSVNNSLSTLNNNISAVDNSSRVFRVGYNPSNTSTLYKWNNSQWVAYDENQEAYNALVAAHTQGRVIQIIGFDNENNQNDGSIYSLQYFNETAVPAPTGSNLSTFNMLFYCHCVVARNTGTTQINRIYLYMNENGSFQTVIENN